MATRAAAEAAPCSISLVLAALSLAILGLAKLFTLSAFHPRDTYELKKLEDGSRAWEVTLPHPLIHLVKKQPTAASK